MLILFIHFFLDDLRWNREPYLGLQDLQRLRQGQERHHPAKLGHVGKKSNTKSQWLYNYTGIYRFFNPVFGDSFYSFVLSLVMHRTQLTMLARASGIFSLLNQLITPQILYKTYA